MSNFSWNSQATRLAGTSHTRLVPASAYKPPTYAKLTFAPLPKRTSAVPETHLYTADRCTNPVSLPRSESKADKLASFSTSAYRPYYAGNMSTEKYAYPAMSTAKEQQYKRPPEEDKTRYQPIGNPYYGPAGERTKSNLAAGSNLPSNRRLDSQCNFDEQRKDGTV